MQSTLDPVVFPRVTPEPGLPESAFTSFTVDKPFPSRAVDIGFVSHVVDGTLRFTGAEFFPTPLDPRSVLPPGFTVQRQHVDPSRVILYAVGPEAAIRVYVDDEDTTVWLAARSPQGLKALACEVRDLGAGAHIEGRVGATLWRWRKGEARSTGRSLVVDEWASIERNYPAPTREVLGSLAGLCRPEGRGRLILWHGQPGTGKTSAVLGLLKEWSGWCDGHIVTDPAAFFGDPDYLMTVMKARSPIDRLEFDGSTQRRWKLVVAEDADTYLDFDAHQRSGPGLGHLLNLTDGVLGRGSPTLVLLTTNANIGRLHPAVTRPGRCLAVAEFPRFTQAEAREWLGPEPSRAPTGPMTLADLYEARQQGQLRTAIQNPPIGVYL